MTEDEIKTLINEEINKESLRSELDAKRQRANEIREISDQIVETFSSQLCANRGRFSTFPAFESCIVKFGLTDYETEDIFTRIISAVEQHFIEHQPTDWDANSFDLRQNLDQTALDYFVDRILNGLSGCDNYAVSLSEVKRRIDNDGGKDRGLVSRALRIVEARLQREIDYLCHQAEFRATLSELIQDTQGYTSSQLSKHKEARLDRVVLAMNYLLERAGVGAKCPKSKRIEFIDFVSPYSRHTIKPQLDRLHEKATENPFEYKRDMEIIREFFRTLGLSDVVEQIDRDMDFGT